ncbi:putative SGNH hydrolase-type esterase domain-containing protein [Rosa chinensis]|uniref:Putative SGNH hydrolase-type esterase domain-containing protein n=1 Tax=Rosa chinensis TaxID=74649 RepID=A0A2P6RBP7_ROSCH|nr:GDSL esterase/lipase At5g03610 isoform X1 [Rosa chinensis]PRQ43852.1 putative SGNH hydrolase-type esterase domain-containing protein [Rosa chinensis]
MELAKSAQRLFLPLFPIFCFISGEGGARQLVSATVQSNWRPTKLFVFGDSFAATGNNDNDFLNIPWNYPYGKTFPGKATGRYSDGRVLTDFIAKFIGVKSPISYKLKNKVAGDYLKYGMNFAYADTGVTSLSYFYPNLTTQIDYFQRIIEGASSVYNTTDLHSSVALVTVSGDDYESYIFSMEGQTPAHPLQSWKSFSTSIVNEVTTSLKRIHDLGVKKILVTALEPMGCRPTGTAVFSYKKCNETRNSLSRSHNLLLQEAVAKLNNQTKRSSFVILDLYTSFMSAFKNKGSIKFKDRLKPCCASVTPGYPYGCGTMSDIPGEDTYSICEREAAAFFWDYAHPTQQGWFSVYSNLKATLKKLYQNQ